MRSKKQLILWVLSVLNNESDESHPITQTRIAELISKVYPCDRKTVSRNIKFLFEMGYPIKKTVKGFYMENKLFSVEEMTFIREAVLAAPGMSTEDKEELVGRIADVLTEKYRRKK